MYWGDTYAEKAMMRMSGKIKKIYAEAAQDIDKKIQEYNQRFLKKADCWMQNRLPSSTKWDSPGIQGLQKTRPRSRIRGKPGMPAMNRCGSLSRNMVYCLRPVMERSESGFTSRNTGIHTDGCPRREKRCWKKLALCLTTPARNEKRKIRCDFRSSLVRLFDEAHRIFLFRMRYYR